MEEGSIIDGKKYSAALYNFHQDRAPSQGVKSLSLTIPLDLHHTADESFNDGDDQTNDINIDGNDDVINLLCDLTLLIKASLREEKICHEPVR